MSTWDEEIFSIDANTDFLDELDALEGDELEQALIDAPQFLVREIHEVHPAGLCKLNTSAGSLVRFTERYSLTDHPLSQIGSQGEAARSKLAHAVLVEGQCLY